MSILDKIETALGIDTQWRYVLDRLFIYESQHLEGIELSNEWCVIKNGTITIKRQYAWDGCSPSFNFGVNKYFPKGFWLGTWDGPLGDDARPVTWKATLCHDVLCQYRESITGATKEKTIGLFKELLILNHAPEWISTFYPMVVDKLGPQDWK